MKRTDNYRVPEGSNRKEQNPQQWEKNCIKNTVKPVGKKPQDDDHDPGEE
jgi:hypothetical protein